MNVRAQVLTRLAPALAVVAVLATSVEPSASVAAATGHGSASASRGTWAVAANATTLSSTRWKPTQLTPVRGAPGVAYAVEKGLAPRTIAVHRAALRAWPQITTYYGYRNDPTSDHYFGRALDLMIPNYTTTSGKSLGSQVAAWAVAHQPDLNIQYVIWNQHIWNVSRASEGWRLMADRGNDTANHKNHVHISVIK